ncbi:MAG: hypothetical protein KC766_12785, partial [Myxococcales bacterium]|nr:hypothetical protein [Myxococcales bacterium]
MRASLSPTQFTALVFDGLRLDSTLDRYFDWIEGKGAYSKRRRARDSQGIPSPLDRAALSAGATITGDRGSEIATRRGDREVLLRFVHRDDQLPEV